MIEIECVVDSKSLLGEATYWDAKGQVLWWIDIWGPTIHRYDPVTGKDDTWTAPEYLGTLSVRVKGGLVVSMVSGFYFFDLVYDRLGRVYSGVRRGNPTTRFDISVANVRANQVYVVGEVAQPGAYSISSLGTVLTALYAAGGVTERANLRSVEVRRSDKPVASG